MPTSYEERIANATTKKELNRLKERIINSLYLKNKNLDAELIKMIDDKMKTISENRLAELAEAAEDAADELDAEPPPAKRIKDDNKLKELINKKAYAEYYYYKNKTDMEKNIKVRDEIKSHMDGFINNQDDIGDDILTSLTSEFDKRIHSVVEAKRYADYWNVSYMIKLSELEMKKNKKIYEETVKELDEYNKTD